MPTKLPNIAATFNASSWQPPDGGWGWIIVVAYAMCNIVVIPSVGNFGLIFADKFRALHMTATDISLITNVNAAFSMSMGLVSGALLRRFSYRKVGFAAGFLVAVGMVLTAFADSLVAFLVCYGLVTAAGVGLAVSAFSLALNSYFLEKRNKAVGISLTLTGLGPIGFPYLISVWLVEYGVTGCVMLLGGLCLHIVAAALLLQPVKWHMKQRTVDVELDVLRTGEGSKPASTVQCDRIQHKTHKPDHCVDSQSIYGLDQMASGQTPSYVARSIASTTSPTKTPLLVRTDPRFERSISHVLQRTLSHNSEPSAHPNPPLSIRPQLRWFEAGSNDSVNLGSSVDVFSEDTRSRLSAAVTPIPKSLKAVTETTVNQTDSEQKPLTITHTDPEPISQSCSSWLVAFFDLTLFRDLTYVNIMLGMSLAVFAELNFTILTPFIFNDLAYTTPQIASFLSLLAVADIVSRFAAPFVGDRLRQPPRIMYMISMVMLIAARMTILVVSSYRAMLFVCVGLGVAKGVRTVYMQLVIPSHVPIERLASAAGLQMVVNGLVIIVLGPVVGLIRDWTGSYRNCILFINAITCVTLTMWTVEFACRRRRQHQKANSSTNNQQMVAIIEA